jgi:LL-diaminopimelate aminotransferase
MRLAKRVESLPPYLFVEISRKIAEKKAQGLDVITFAIGDPDIPTPPHILNRLIEAAKDPANHRYPESAGLQELRQAIANWYKSRFGVTIDPEKQVVPPIGAKEGIGHMALCFIDPGDIALVPDPGYPVYSVGTMFAGGESHYMPLKEENDFLPDLEAIPAEIAAKAKLMWLNYPNNPTSAVANIGYFKRVVDFAKEHDIVVCHDAPYSEIAYDGYKPVSFLEAPGAIEVGMEFHSFSKSYNMTGWRIGMAVGNTDVIDALSKVKSNLDSGIPQAIQYAAIEALTTPQDIVSDMVAIYQKRRDKVVAALTRIGIRTSPPKASLYIWAKIPNKYTSIEFASKLLEEALVVVTPGIGYGPSGEGYIRISLTTPDDRLEEGLARLEKWYSNLT